MTLTKAKLIDQVRKRVSGVRPWEAPRLVAKVLRLIREALAKGEDVLITGFGKFVVREKNRRRGRNPQTGEELMLRERRVVTFKPATTLRAELNPRPVEPDQPRATRPGGKKEKGQIDYGSEERRPFVPRSSSTKRSGAVNWPTPRLENPGSGPSGATSGPAPGRLSLALNGSRKLRTFTADFGRGAFTGRILCLIQPRRKRPMMISSPSLKI